MKFAMIVGLIGIALGGPAACVARPAAQPAWVDTLIATFQAAPVANPPRRIVHYRYRDQRVYYVPATCCDRPSVLYDANGGVLCAPDGGMTGRGDGRCADFHDQRSEESLIWSDPRALIEHGARTESMPIPPAVGGIAHRGDNGRSRSASTPCTGAV
ncbi:MAG: hypothetical protein WAS23_00425 [Dokdonella sp.]|uniref:DUF6970 domain-containing protein n=1 Tax=Dokdonella sp. TaxID=2291710 RepID=UPI003BB1330E